MSLSQAERIEKQARKLFLALNTVAMFNDETRTAVVERTIELLEGNGLVITADGLKELANRYRRLV